MAEMLNKVAYESEPDNLVRAAQYPVLHRIIEITNPKVAIKRGQTIVYNTGTKELSVGGATDANIVGIVSADIEADTTAEKISVDAYVSGAFNAAYIVGPEVDRNIVLGAQANGIYLV